MISKRARMIFGITSCVNPSTTRETSTKTTAAAAAAAAAATTTASTVATVTSHEKHVHSFLNILFLFLLTSSSHLVYVHASTAEVIMTSCCALGTSVFYNSSHACPQLQLDTKQMEWLETQADVQTCRAVASVCCLRLRQRRKCDLGKKMFFNTGSCDGSQQHGDSHFECCNCCQLGIMNRQATRVPQCRTHPELTFSTRCTETYMSCCVNGTMEQKICPKGMTWNVGFSRCEVDKRRHRNDHTPRPKYSVALITTTAYQPYPADEDGGPKAPRQSTTGFKNKCPLGFLYNSSYRRCIDINECDQSPCYFYEECQNTQGSYMCVPKSIRCPQGYQQNHHMTDCEDINECLEHPNPCYSNEDCENLPGSFRCVAQEATQCPTGYRINYYNTDCEDIDECSEGTHSCAVTHDCLNNEGSFQCIRRTCPPEFELSNYSGRCEYVSCADGLIYNSDDKACIDIDECTLYPNLCSPGQTCVNLLKSYECKYLIDCPTGTKLDQNSGTCEDIDECSSPGLNECSLHSRCENIFGSYMCRCDDGFKHYDYDAFTCVDIDECKEWGPCDQGCMNTLGSYECYCKTGFQLREDKRMCIDINECDTPVSGNPVCYGLCHNTIGSYMCHCPAGYNNTKDKRFCQDIDECKMDPNLCGGPDDVCINTLGGYKCQTVKCPKSFILVKSRIFNTDMSVFCRKMQQTCPFNEHDCLIIQSFSINFIVLDTSKIITPMTLHVVKMKMTRGSEMRYSLEVVSAIDPASGYDAGIDERIFYANKLPDDRVAIELYEQIDEPVDIELQLTIDLYDSQRKHKGKYISKLYIYVTKHTYSPERRYDYSHWR